MKQSHNQLSNVNILKKDIEIQKSYKEPGRVVSYPDGCVIKKKQGKVDTQRIINIDCE